MLAALPLTSGLDELTAETQRDNLWTGLTGYTGFCWYDALPVLQPLNVQSISLTRSAARVSHRRIRIAFLRFLQETAKSCTQIPSIR